jgi:hypothetical protein
VAPENGAPPARAEAENSIFCQGFFAPSGKASAGTSVGEFNAQQLERVVQILELGDLEATLLQVVNSVLC